MLELAMWSHQWLDSFCQGPESPNIIASNMELE